jgi:hypothetical protein
MGDRPASGGEHTDIAALSAAALAAVLALLVTPGEYGFDDAGLTISLLLLIFGYAWPHRRTRIQSAAIASIIALSAIPGVGFLDEMALFPGTWAELIHRVARGRPDPTAVTRVPDWHMVVAWILVFSGALLLDKKNQNRRRN